MAAQAKRIVESKVPAARAEGESAKLMRQICFRAADILSSALAMQNRYRETIKSMVNSAKNRCLLS